MSGGGRAAVVLCNSLARGGAQALAREASETLRRGGFAVEMVAPAGSSAAALRAAVENGASLVVAVGGDGTAREIAQSLSETLGTWRDGGPAPGDAPLLLILPGGTGNSVHRSLDGDRTAGETLALAVDGEAVRHDLDLARIASHDRAVLLGASAGFLRWTVEATARFPDLGGRDLYAAAGLAVAQELRPYAGRVSVDGRLLVEAPLALAAVGGARRRGGSLHLFPRSQLDDGLLDACAIAAGGPDEAIPLLLAAMEGAHLDLPGVHYAQGREVVLECLDGPLPFEHDGDIWPGDDATLQLTAVPAAIPVLAPRELPG